MAVRIEFHPGAENDIEQARAWYAQRSPIVAHAFLIEAQRSIEIIAQAPDRCTLALHAAIAFRAFRFALSIAFMKVR